MPRTPSAPNRRRRASILVAALALVWLLAGLRQVGDDRFGVLEGPLFGGGERRVDAGWVLAPPGLLRLTTYPLQGVELSLPQADEARIAAPNGSRYGFRGWITVRPRPQDWRALHAAADRRGVAGAVLASVRAAADGLSADAERVGLEAALARDFPAALERALTERGLDLRRLDLDSIDYLAVSAGATTDLSEARLLVVGLDGLDWTIVDGLIEQGKLPHLKRLIDHGTRAKLLTLSPMLSPVIWTTVATGVEPSRHGILDFLVDDGTGEARQPVTSAQRRVPTFWEILSRSGVEVGVNAWWATWPADPVRGYVVSDRLAYQLFGFRPDLDDAQGKTWPPDLYAEIRPRIVAPESVPWDDVAPYLSGTRTRPEQFDDEERKMVDEFRTLLASGRTYRDITLALRGRFEPRLEIVYFEGTDTVGHLFMPYRPPPLPGVDPGRIASFSGMVDRYYETADGYLGQLLEGLGEDWTVMVLSDHGFATDATRPRTTDSRIGHGAAADWHRRFGVLILSGAHVKHGERLEEASVYDIAPTVMALFAQPVPQSWPGRVLARAIDPEFLERHPVRYRPDDPQRGDARARALDDPTAAELLQKLESLGYVSGGGSETGAGDSLTARNNAGVAMLAEGKYAEAEAEFRRGIAENPGAPMLLVNLGLALKLQGRVEEAAAQFESALDTPTTARMAGHMLGEIRMEQGRLDEAERLLQQVLAREPDAAEVRNTLGQLLERRGDLAGAEAEYREAARLDPDAALARNNLGTLARRRGDLDEAERWYLRAIEADPYFMGAYNNLAIVYQDRGQLDKARDLYARALAKAPDNADVLTNLASWHFATGDFDRARELWQRATAVDPSDPSPWNNLAGIEIHFQRWDEAERLLRKALLLDDGYGDARMNLALVAGARGDLDGAREQLRRATEDPRTGAASWIKLGALQLGTGFVDDAHRALEKARSLAPTQVEALNLLGECYRRKGRTAEALELWRRSLELKPDQPRLREFVEREMGPGE